MTEREKRDWTRAEKIMGNLNQAMNALTDPDSPLSEKSKRIIDQVGTDLESVEKEISEKYLSFE